MPAGVDPRTLDQQIANQVRLWEERRKAEAAEHRAGRLQVGELRYGPYVLVSRSMGCGGEAVAKLVGRRLGWPVYDRELVNMIAERTQTRERLIEGLDERVRGVIADLVASAAERFDPGDVGYLHNLREVLLTLGQQGDVVIVGRGAQFILPAECGLRVRIIGSRPVRQQTIAARLQVDEREAGIIVRNTDRQRRIFARRNFDADIEDPHTYDVVINTDQLSTGGAADIVLSALSARLGVELPE